jgi:hypothetical protein
LVPSEAATVPLVIGVLPSLSDMYQKVPCILPYHASFVPQVGYLEILIHLVASEVDGVCGIMSFSEYYILDFLDIEYTNSSFIPKHSLIILSEPR